MLAVYVHAAAKFCNRLIFGYNWSHCLRFGSPDTPRDTLARQRKILNGRPKPPCNIAMPIDSYTGARQSTASRIEEYLISMLCHYLGLTSNSQPSLFMNSWAGSFLRIPACSFFYPSPIPSLFSTIAMIGCRVRRIRTHPMPLWYNPPDHSQ